MANVTVKSANPVEENPNPAIGPEEAQAARQDALGRISMDVPMPRLGGIIIPGHHCHWFANYPGRVQQAQRAGYEFVSAEEVLTSPTKMLGADPISSGNMDMGSRVSVVTEGGETGKGLELFLMKIRLEWYLENKKVLNDRNNLIIQAIHKGATGAMQAGETQEDFANRYVRERSNPIPSFQVRR